jgi:carbonic anhydrase
MYNNGHTIEFKYDAGSNLQWKGETYTLKQFHFHASSEHQVQSNSYPMEVHLVHENAAGKLAVVGIFFNAGAENQLLKKFEANYPNGKGTYYASSDRYTVADLYPNNKGYYNYSGSLTTPPCTEGVTWIVMKEPISASSAQIQKISSIMKQNNRPVQKLNTRQVQSYN